MHVSVKMYQQVVIIRHLVQSLAPSENRSVFASTIQRSAWQSGAYVSEKDLWNTKVVFVEHWVNVFLNFFFALVRVPLPDLFGISDVWIARERAAKADHAEAKFEDELLFLNIDDVRSYLGLPVEIDKRVVVARDEDNLALEQILEEK